MAPTVLNPAWAVDERRVPGQIRAIRPGSRGREIEVATEYGDVFLPFAAAPPTERVWPGERVWLSLWRDPGVIEPRPTSTRSASSTTAACSIRSTRRASDGHYDDQDG